MTSGAYQVFIQLWNVVAQRTFSGPLIRGVNQQQPPLASGFVLPSNGIDVPQPANTP